MTYWLSLVLAACLAVTPARASFLNNIQSKIFGKKSEEPAGRFAENAVSANALEESIRAGLDKVEEIKFLREEMAKLGLKHGWLFGGTAAAFGHYANWDLRRTQGDTRFQPNRFDYDYTNIFRSTQDLDIVIDGSAEQAEKLERRLREVYPHLQGTQSAWEVRLLRSDRGSKEALLNNPNFLDQHTDSNSTGLIEFTKPANGAPLVHDLRDANSRPPKFFEDIRLGKLKYYFSPKHQTTARFKQGLNPPIFSVIRYFTKLFQYELEVDPADEKYLRQIIKDFKPSTLEEVQALNWIRKNGKKLFQNAVNLEYAAKTLKDFGLSDKLTNFDDPNQVDSLAWWVNRKPLESKPLGAGPGATAKSLGLDVVAHETSDYLAYESITRSHTGEPNVFTSRVGAVGETAAYGEGFYTKVGKEGARGTGITIRFRLKPDAREGTDFTFDRNAQFVVVHNKQALEVIPESLDLTPQQFFDLLIKNSATWGANDKSILEKFRRRMKNKLIAKPDEISGIAKTVNAALLGEELNQTLLREWISFADQIKGQNELMEQLLRPLTQSKNTWVNLLANIKLSERGLPSDLKIKKPLLTYFQAVQSFSPSPYEPDDPYFKELFKDINLKAAKPQEIKEIFQLLKNDLKAIGPNAPLEHMHYIINPWRTLWEAGYKNYPLELKDIAREMANDPTFRVTPRYMAMDALVHSLNAEKDPELIEFFLKKLADEQRPTAYRAINGLRDHAADDPRTPKALAAYFDHEDDSTRQHSLNAFEKIKTSDVDVQHQLIRSLSSTKMYGTNAIAGLRANPPTDSESARMLEKLISKESIGSAAYAMEVRSLMPDRGKGSIEAILDLLKMVNEHRVVLAAVKVLVKHPETKQFALETALKQMDTSWGFPAINLAKFLHEHDYHLPALVKKLEAVAVQDGGYSWKTKELIEKISDQMRGMSSPGPGANCAGAYAGLVR